MKGRLRVPAFPRDRKTTKAKEKKELFRKKSRSIIGNIFYDMSEERE